MCAIVDANKAARFFSIPPDTDLLPLWDWIERGRGSLILGGQLEDELSVIGNAGRAILGWARRGRIYIEDREAVYEEQKEISDHCRSNDAHIIALARVTGARLLCSGDSDLHEDFGNPGLINRPRGVVYQDASHAHLLDPHAQWHQHCPHRPRR